MLFPRTIFADKNTIWRQYFHLVSEVWELGVAIIKAKFWGLMFRYGQYSFISQAKWNHVANEAVDTQISSDTLLRIALEQHGADSHGAYTRVTCNNTKRGYYGEVKENG